MRKGDLNMIEIGKFQNLKIANFTSFGAYLDAGTGVRHDNILLPIKQLPEDAKEGDELEVFIYRDSEERLIATREKTVGSIRGISLSKSHSQDSDRGLFGYWFGKRSVLTIS